MEEAGPAVEARPRFSLRTLDDGNSTQLHLEVELPGEEREGRRRPACRRSCRRRLPTERRPAAPSIRCAPAPCCRCDRQQPDPLQHRGRPTAACARPGTLSSGECWLSVTAATGPPHPSRMFYSCAPLQCTGCIMHQQHRAPAYTLNTMLPCMPPPLASMLPPPHPSLSCRTSVWECQ